jgi:hypothetical protein
LSLTSLGETAAVALHQRRNSQGFEQLAADAKDAGEIAAHALAEIQRKGNEPAFENGASHGREVADPSSAEPARRVHAV